MLGIKNLQPKLIEELNQAIQSADLDVKGENVFETGEMQENNIIDAFNSLSSSYFAQQTKNKNFGNWIYIDKQFGDIMITNRETKERILIDIKVTTDEYATLFPTVSMDSIANFCTYGELENKYYVSVKKSPSKQIIIDNAKDVYDLFALPIDTTQIRSVVKPCSTRSKENKTINAVFGSNNYLTTTRSFVKPDIIHSLIEKYL